MFKLITTKEKVLHYAPSSHLFFNGYGGYQLLVRSYYLFDILHLWSEKLDRETVPHWHYVQSSTLGSSEWKSRLVEELEGRANI